MSTCHVCARSPHTDGLCTYHLAAHRNLQAGFHRWREAFGGLRFRDYLGRLLELPETGTWVREVAEWQLDTRRGEE